MRMALTSGGGGGSTSSPSAPDLSSSNSSPEFHKSTPFVRYPPRTRTEQYWAARALTAETLLFTKKEHYQDMRIATDSSEMKRVTEITQLTKMYDERQMKLEKWLVTLLGVLLIFSFAVLISHISLAHTGIRGKKASWTHFTIPILSPFASVVEHETSVVGSKTIVGISLVLAGLAYVSLRFWMSRHQAVTVLK
ncbi:hypothetical protein D9757_001027 [Collybiopsis confluens]|uniref:Uncharacterized protein n=1 Tax=Collybiopsis confluens TaxID=2823264 RepID=A0A8H5MG41_9AGAR|nr:hypothetical protein D9757_001027 [Collybiopsis confluens]